MPMGLAGRTPGSELASGKESVSTIWKRTCPPVGSELQCQVWEGGDSQGSALKTQENCLLQPLHFSLQIK